MVAVAAPASASVARQRSRRSERESTNMQPARSRKASGAQTSFSMLSVVKPNPSTPRTMAMAGSARRRLRARKAASPMMPYTVNETTAWTPDPGTRSRGNWSCV